MFNSSIVSRIAVSSKLFPGSTAPPGNEVSPWLGDMLAPHLIKDMKRPVHPDQREQDGEIALFPDRLGFVFRQYFFDILQHYAITYRLFFLHYTQHYLEFEIICSDHFSNLSSDDLHVEFAVARAIVIPEVDALPSPQQHLSFRQDDRFAGTGQG